jgi:3-deoxy-manno-octulosonate cytidylyltransferase (CMP-KDO synthetase)
MKIVAMIPARLASTRLPSKLLQQIGSYNVLQTTYINALNTNLFNEVCVVADDAQLEKCILEIGGKVLRSTKPHATGTDRIAEFAHVIDADIIINIQADEPEINSSLIHKLIGALNNDEYADISTPMHHISEAQAGNTNFVKVITDDRAYALLFSRSKIPFNRDGIEQVNYFRHVGVYAFRKQALMNFATWPQPQIEIAEQLENLRMLYNGQKIKLVEIAESTVGIDTAEDLHAYKMRHGLE